MRDIFIIGSKGIPAKYGGFETFVDQLAGCRKSEELCYHVACMDHAGGEFEYNRSRCFRVKTPKIGPAKAVWYDLAAFFYCLRYLKAHPSDGPVVYVLACRIGPFIGFLKRRLRKLGGSLFVNPDGHEWMRAKWNRVIRRYWRFSEKGMVKHADLIICDSKNMEAYILNTYKNYQPKTTYIAYGADVKRSTLADTDETLLAWYRKWGLKAGEYFLIVGRFVPENNYETMLREFMRTETDKKLAIISNAENNPFYRKLKETTGFGTDRRVVFCQTVYEVGGRAAFYWTKDEGSLSALIEKAERLSGTERNALGEKARERILTDYRPEQIAMAYERLFLGEKNGAGTDIGGGRNV